MDSEIREEIDSYMSKCIGCRKCDRICPSRLHGGCTPSIIMAGGDGNVRACIGCGKCTEVCPVTDPKKVMAVMKAELLGLHPPDHFKGCGYVTTPCDPAFSDGIPEVTDGDDVYVMPGCVAKRRVPFVVYAARKALVYIGKGNSELPGNTCCTYPFVFRLEPKSEKKEIMDKMSVVAGDRPTVTLCGGCTNELKENGIDFPHICTYLASNLDSIRSLKGVNMKVAIEPGCSVERYRDDFIAVVKACGADIINTTSGCCGKGIPGVQQGLMAEREAECAGADAIIIGCPNCLSAYDTYEGGIPVLHISELVCLAAGDDFTQRYHRIKLKR